MKYEFQFVVPVNVTDPRYAQRLRDFREIGLLNIPEDKKIKLVLLAKKGTLEPSFTNGWPKGCDTFINYYSKDHHIYKLCRYYLGLNEFESKWYVSVDDDSITDIGGLIKTLSNYDYEEPIYFSTWHVFGCAIHPHPEIAILKKLKMLRFLKGNWRHDWEANFMSRQAIIQTMTHPISRKYLRARKDIWKGFTDQIMPYAVRMAGVETRRANFSDPYPAVNNFSYWGGKMNHIHYVAHDYQGGDVAWIKNWLKKNNKPQPI